MPHIKSVTFVAINLAVISGAATIALRPSLRELSMLASMVVATFAGAWLAFQFGAERIARDKRDSDLRAGHMVLAVLTECRDRALHYQRNYVEPVRNNSDVWWIMRPGPELESLDATVDLSALSFLLPRYADAWRVIVLQERRQKLLCKTIADRKRLIYEVVFPKFETAGLSHGQAVMGDDIERILGPAITATLKDETSAVVETIDDYIRSLENCIETLKAVLAALYPGSDFIARGDRRETSPLPGQ